MFWNSLSVKPRSVSPRYRWLPGWKFPQAHEDVGNLVHSAFRGLNHGTPSLAFLPAWRMLLISAFNFADGETGGVIRCFVNALAA